MSFSGRGINQNKICLIERLIDDDNQRRRRLTHPVLSEMELDELNQLEVKLKEEQHKRRLSQRKKMVDKKSVTPLPVAKVVIRASTPRAIIQAEVVEEIDANRRNKCVIS